MKGTKPKNKTILAVIHDGIVLQLLKPLIEDVIGELSVFGSSVMFTVPADWFSGPLCASGEA